MKRFFENRWKDMGNVDVISLKNGTFVFNFSDEEHKVKALEQSPWVLGSKMMFLRPWTPELKLKKEELTTVPVWIKLPNLKIHYYTVNGLRKMASYVRKPLYTDKQTTNQDLYF